MDRNLMISNSYEDNFNDKSLNKRSTIVQEFVNTIVNIQTKLIDSVSHVHHFFIPSCITHMFLLRKYVIFT